MSDNIGKIDEIKLEDKICIGPKSPFLPKKFIQDSPIALSLHITNNFFRHLFLSHKETELHYLTIINSQLEGFHLKTSQSRLETRFSQIAYRVNAQLKGKFRTGRKRDTYLKETVTVAVFENEIENVKNLTCKLDRFNEQNVVLEKRCQDLLQSLSEAKSDQSNLLMENNLININVNSEKKFKEKYKNENEKLQCEVGNLRDQTMVLEEKVSVMSKQLNKITSEQTQILQENQKFRLHMNENVSVQNKRSNITPNRKNMFKSDCQRALWFADLYGLSPKVLTCSSSDGSDVKVKFTDYSTLENCEKQKLRNLIYILDKFAISDRACQELSVMSDDFPTRSAILNERKLLDENFTIQRCPGNQPGAYVTVKSEIEKYVENNGAKELLKIKFSGDGTRVSRVSNFVNLSVSFINDDKCVSQQNIKTIAIIKCKETYEELSVACAPIFREINELVSKGSVMIDEKQVPVEIYFGGDLKFIQICLGLQGSIANYSCAWCHIHKSERTEVNRPQEYYDSKEMKRTAENLQSNSSCDKFGCKRKPLIQIDPEYVVPDELHLMLRIGDVLMSNLIDDCKQLDNKREVLGEKKRHIDELVSKIRECGITFSMWTDKNTSELNWSALNGRDYQILFSALPEKLLFVVTNDTQEDVVFLWKNFWELYDMIKHGNEEDFDKLGLFNQIQTWMLKFLGLTKKGRLGYNRITPYMHILQYHIPSIIEKHGFLQKFSGQGVEKLNDAIKLIHQKSSNKFDQTCDELIKRKRMELLADSSCEREKRTYSKHNGQYWEKDIHLRHAAKKRRIELEMTAAHENYKECMKENEKPLSEMSVSELKEKLKSLGISTKLRKKEKLVELLQKQLAA